MNNALLSTAAAIEALQARISFINLVRTFEADTPCVTFDLLVDGQKLDVAGLEWTDDEGDIVVDDRNNGFNVELLDAVHEALGDVDDSSETCVAFFALLQRAVEAHDAAQADEDERQRLEYSNALISFDDITVSGAIGLHLAGFEPLGVFELNKNAVETLKKTSPFGPLFIGDLREVDFKVYRDKVDLVAGGLPCQPFSSLGMQKRDQDGRDLFTTAMKIVADVQPRAVMFENTVGFKQRPGKLYVTEIISELRKLGYSAGIFDIAASEYGLAQRRARVVLVGFRDGLMRQFDMPPKFPQWNTTLGEALHDLMAANGWRGADRWAQNADKIAPTIVGGSNLSGSLGFSSKVRYKEWAGLGIDATRLAKEAPGPDEEEGILPRLTLAMGARLQGFPEGWAFQGSARQQRHQVANAFPPIVAAAVGLAIRKTLTGHDVDFEGTLSNLRFVPGKPVHVWWGDEYKNSRLSMRAEGLGLPTGVVPRIVRRPHRMKKFWKESSPATVAADTKPLFAEA